MIEEKIVKSNDKELIGTLEHFMWKKDLDDSRSTKSKIVFKRDTEIPYYNDIIKYEEQFNNLQNELHPVYKIRMLPFILLTLALVVPGLIYKIVVNNHNAKIEEPNNLIYEKMEEILDKSSRYTNI